MSYALSATVHSVISTIFEKKMEFGSDQSMRYLFPLVKWIDSQINARAFFVVHFNFRFWNEFAEQSIISLFFKFGLLSFSIDRIPDFSVWWKYGKKIHLPFIFYFRILYIIFSSFNLSQMNQSEKKNNWIWPNKLLVL